MAGINSITAQDLLEPVKQLAKENTLQGAVNQLAKEVTLQSAVSQLEKMNLALKDQAKQSNDLRQELEDETKEALDFYKEISSLLEEMEKDGIKSNKTVTTRIDKAVKALTKKPGYTSSKSSMSDPTRKVGEMKDAGVIITPKLSTTSAVEYGNELTDAIKRATQSMVGTVLSGVLGGTDAYRIITKGMIEEQYDFASEMNKIAFRTEGITDSSREMQKSFRITSDVVRETGYDLGTLQNQVVKGAKRGLKESQSIAKIGLGLGKLLGSNEQEAAALSDTFFDWNQKLGLSKTQLGSIAHEIKEVSRYTGLVGENLANAVKNSEKYLQKMQAAGNLTASAAKNVITLQAEAQKIGIDDKLSEAMTALTSKDDFLRSSKEAKTLLLLAGQASGELKNVMDGTVLNSTTSLKNMSKGLQEQFKTFSGGVDIKDVNTLNSEQKSLVDLKLKSATGYGIGDFEKTITAFEKGGATFSDKMNNINNELKNATTNEEKLTLERKKQDLYLTESMSNSSAFSEAAKNATSLEDAVFRLQNTMNPDQIISYNKELANVAGTFSEDLKVKVLSGDKIAIAEAINLSAADAIKKSGGGDYTQRVKSAISNKDTKKLVSLQERMNKEQQKLGIKDATIGDPIERATDQIKLMNENLLSFTGPAIMWAAQTAGSTGIMAGLMALIVAQGYFGAESIRAWGDVFMGGFKGLKNTLMGAASTASPIATAMSTASAPIAGAARVSPMAAAMSTASAPIVAESTAVTSATSAVGLSLKTLAKGFFITSAVVGALTGSYWAGQEAANHFNKEIEDLTMSQLYASKGAGLLTGALNFLTFGIFDNWLGATGSLTAMLARFNEKIPLLSAVAGLLDVVFGAFYGISKLVINTFSGIVSGLGLILSPFISVIGSVASAFSALISPFFALDEKVAGTGSVLTTVSDLIGGVGTVIGGVFKGIGYLVYGILTPFAMAIDLIVKAISTFYRIIRSPLLMIFNGIKDSVFGLFKIVKGIFTFDFSMILDGLKQSVFGTVKTIAGMFFQIPVMIFTALKEIGPMLINVISSLSGTVMGAFKAVIVELPAYLWNSFFLGLKSLTENDMFGPIFEPFLEILKPIHEGVYAVIDAFYSLMEPFNALLSIFSSNSDNTREGISLMGIFTSSIRALSTVIGMFIRVALFPLSIVFQVLGGALKLVAGFITYLKDGLMGLVEIIKYTVDAIISPFKFLYDILVGHSIIPDLVFAIIGCFSGLASSVLGTLFSFAPKVLSFFSGVGKGIINSASSVMSYIKSTDIFSSIVSNFNLAKDAVSSFFSPLMKGFSKAKEIGAGLFSSIRGFASSALEKGRGFASSALEKGRGLVDMAKTAAPSVVEFAGKFMGKAGSIIGGLVGKAGLKTAGKSILKKLPGIGAIAGAGFALNELIQGNVGGAIREFGSGIVGSIPIIGPALGFAVDMFGDYVINGAKSIGSTMWEGAKSIWEGVKSIGSSIWGGIKSAGSSLWEGVKSIGSTMWESAKSMWDNTKSIGSSMLEGVKSGWDWLFGNDEKVVQKSAKSADTYTGYTSPSQMVTPESAVKTASVQPTGYVSNVYDKVRRNKVEENVGSSKNGNVHLSELVVINNEMLHYMMMNEQNTAKLVELLTSTGSLSGETNGQSMKTKGNSKPRNSSNYNQWQFGRYDQNASLQVVTTGT